MEASKRKLRHHENPNDIMPADYGIASLRQDIALIASHVENYTNVFNALHEKHNLDDLQSTPKK